MFSKKELVIFGIIVVAIAFISFCSFFLGWQVGIGGLLLILVSAITYQFPRTSLYLFLIYYQYYLLLFRHIFFDRKLMLIFLNKMFFCFQDFYKSQRGKIYSGSGRSEALARGARQRHNFRLHR